MLKRIKFSKNGKYIIFKVKNKLFITSSKHSKKLQYKGYNCKICPFTLNVTGKSGGELTTDVWGDITNWFTDPKDFFKLFFSSKNIYESLLFMYNGCENILFKQITSFFNLDDVKMNFIRNLRQVYPELIVFNPKTYELHKKLLSICKNLNTFESKYFMSEDKERHIILGILNTHNGFKKYKTSFLKNIDLKHLKKITHLEVVNNEAKEEESLELDKLENLKSLKLGMGFNPALINFKRLKLEELYIMKGFFDDEDEIDEDYETDAEVDVSFDILKDFSQIKGLKKLSFLFPVKKIFGWKEDYSLDLERLESLELIGDYQLNKKFLEKTTKLKNLILDSQYAQVNFNHFTKNLLNLKRIWLTNVNEIKVNNFKFLTHLHVRGSWGAGGYVPFISQPVSITDDDIKDLYFLKYLSITFGSQKITDNGIKNLLLLQFLSLERNGNLTALALKRLKSLNFLCLRRILGDEEELINLTNLKILAIPLNIYLKNEHLKNLREKSKQIVTFKRGHKGLLKRDETYKRYFWT